MGGRHLRHGVPTGAPSSAKPVPAYHVCQCADCSQEEYFDPRSLRATSGHLFYESEWKKHQRDLKARADALALFASIPEEESPGEESDTNPEDSTSRPISPTDSEAPFGSPTPPSESDEPPKLRRERRARSRDAAPNPHADDYSDILSVQLRVCIDRLSLWHETLAEIEKADLAFATSRNGDGEPLVLSPSHAGNGPAIEFEKWLLECRAIAERGAISSHIRHRLLATSVEDPVSAALEALEAVKEAKYRASLEINFVDASRYYLYPGSWGPIQLLCLLLASTLNVFAQLSIPRTAFILQMLRLLLKTVFTTFRIPEAEAGQIIEGIPTDIRTAFKRLDPDPVTTAFVCCPKCFSLTDISPDGTPPETAYCTNIPQKGGRRCGRRLFKEDSWTPTRRYIHHDLKQWLARFYARPGMEAKLDRKIEVAADEELGELKDIWDGSVLRNFKGPDNERHFLDGNGEGRLIFGLNQDGMNPYGNRTAGKKVSIGPIYLVCLNLPPELRYRMENIFLVGIIPGPTEPSHDEINHFLRPLITDLLTAWNEGFYISRTPQHPHGCRVRCAVVPLIADLPAARQLAGIGSFRSTDWCSECHQKLQERDNLDKDSWILRDFDSHMENVSAWQNAPTEHARKKLYDSNHVRFSEFLRLPYWDPTKFVTVDSMHGFYLGLFRRHVRVIWGMDVTLVEGVDLSSQRSSYVPTSDEIATVIERIRAKGDSKNLSADVLIYLCRHNDLRFSGSLRKLYGRLVKHYDSVGLPEVFEADEEEEASSPERIAFETETRTKLKEYPTDFLGRMCEEMLGGASSGTYAAMGQTKMIEQLQDMRKRLGIIDEKTGHLKQPDRTGSRKKRKSTVLLGSYILKEVRLDMERRPMPSYVGRPPSHPGEAAWGKFTADQWKTFCTQHLPFTLTRLWGHFRNSQHSAERRKYDMLQNFLHLVSAVILATTKTVTPGSIAEYEVEMHTYLSGLLQLYPGAQIESYQHMAMHFGDLLRRWGPVHAWRCFAFERYNGVLQQLKTNNKFGEMEATMLRSFCRRQNLASFYAPQMIPEVLSPATSIFQQYFNYDSRGTWADDVGAGDPGSNTVALFPYPAEPMQDRLYQKLTAWLEKHDPLALSSTSFIDRSAKFADEVVTSRYKYTVRKDDASGAPKKVDPHCSVVTNDGRVGFIRTIFIHRRDNGSGIKEEVFVVVRCLQELTPADAALDYFRTSPLASGRLVYNTVTSKTVYSLSQISHCTQTVVRGTGIKTAVRHAIPVLHEMTPDVNELSADIEQLNGSLTV